MASRLWRAFPHVPAWGPISIGETSTADGLIGARSTDVLARLPGSPGQTHRRGYWSGSKTHPGWAHTIFLSKSSWPLPAESG